MNVSSGPDFYAEDLAYVHHVGFTEGVRAAAPALLAHIGGAGEPGGLVVDLGCGAGEWAAALTGAGYAVLGIDVAPAFLALARQAAPMADFRQGSVWDAELPPCVAVTALGEVLCYVAPGAPEPPLRAFFERVATALPAGGRLVFDLIVADGGAPLTTRSWRSGADWAVLVAVEEDAAAGRLTRDITVFRAVAGAYRRSQERHQQVVYDPATVTAWLEAAGFTVETAPGYGAAPLPPRRLAFIATRQEGATHG